MVKGSSKSKAKDHLKKLNLNGDKSVLYAILPAKKFPDQKKEEAINKKIANKYLFPTIYQRASLKMTCHIYYHHFSELLHNIYQLFL